MTTFAANLSMLFTEAPFLERFGQPLSALQSGDALTDLSFAKPRRRRIFFGSYF